MSPEELVDYIENIIDNKLKTQTAVMSVPAITEADLIDRLEIQVRHAPNHAAFEVHITDRYTGKMKICRY